MENYDQRRRQGSDDPSRRYPHNEERGRERESWRPDDDRGSRRARGEQTGWLDYDRDYGRSEPRYGDRNERGREEQRYGRSGSERSTFSPDWSRDDAEPFRSDDPYYARNRDRGGWGDPSRGGAGDYSRSQSRNWQSRDWGGDDRAQWDRRSRESIPREQRELSERSHSGDYYSPDWPYERDTQRREPQRARDDEGQSHYRGYYRSSASPFSYPGGSGMLYSESWTLHGPYTGRGPKGYKRSDQQIVEEASHRLERDGEIDASEIEVTAENGILTLRGSVPDRRTKRRAEECVESVYGVRDVMNELKCGQQSQWGSQEWQDRQGSQGSQGSQSLQGSQDWQGGQGSQTTQGSQAAQRGQSAQGAKGSQASTSTARGSTGTPDQSGEDRKPTH